MKKETELAKSSINCNEDAGGEPQAWSENDICNHIIKAVRNTDDAVSAAQPISLFFIAAIPAPNQGPITVIDLAKAIDLPSKDVSMNIRRLVACGRVNQFHEKGRRDCLYRRSQRGHDELLTMMPWLDELEPRTLGLMRNALNDLMPNLGFVNLAIMAAVFNGSDNVRDICGVVNRDFRQTKMSVILRKYPILDKTELATISKTTNAISHKYTLNDLSRGILALVAGKP